MSAMAIHTLVGTALIDREFCKELLNGKRASLLETCGLSDEEQSLVSAIEAQTIQEFTAGLCRWLPARALPLEC